jgi:hypothetical protein
VPHHVGEIIEIEIENRLIEKDAREHDMRISAKDTLTKEDCFNVKHITVLDTVLTEGEIRSKAHSGDGMGREGNDIGKQV